MGKHVLELDWGGGRSATQNDLRPTALRLRRRLRFGVIAGENAVFQQKIFPGVKHHQPAARTVLRDRSANQGDIVENLEPLAQKGRTLQINAAAAGRRASFFGSDVAAHFAAIKDRRGASAENGPALALARLSIRPAFGDIVRQANIG